MSNELNQAYESMSLNTVPIAVSPSKRRRKNFGIIDEEELTEKRAHSVAPSDNDEELTYSLSPYYYLFNSNKSPVKSPSSLYRGPYKCSKCGQTKKGHVCPYGSRDVKDAEVQVAIDPEMTVIKMKENEVVNQQTFQHQNLDFPPFSGNI